MDLLRAVLWIFLIAIVGTAFTLTYIVLSGLLTIIVCFAICVFAALIVLGDLKESDDKDKIKPP